MVLCAAKSRNSAGRNGGQCWSWLESGFARISGVKQIISGNQC
jgi:hypothetical protein